MKKNSLLSFFKLWSNCLFPKGSAELPCKIIQIWCHFFLLNFFVEIILDSHAVKRNNTEKYFVPFTQISPKVAFNKTIVNITMILTSIQSTNLVYISSVLCVRICVCSYVCVQVYTLLSHIQVCEYIFIVYTHTPIYINVFNLTSFTMYSKIVLYLSTESF